MRRIGLFGGSFDPIHGGHVETLVAAKESADLDVVFFLPTARPPHKKDRKFAPAWARYAMVEMALLDHPGLLVSTHELTLGRPAYTVETVEHFKSAFPESEIVLMMGADSYNELDSWKRWRDLYDLASLVVLARPGSNELRSDLPAPLRPLDESKVQWLEAVQVDQSSTQIRRALAEGEPVEGLAPAVLNYIQKYSLYR